MSGCNCEWLGLCYCEGPPVPVMTPAKKCQIRVKGQKTSGDATPMTVTADEPTPSKE